MVLQRDKNIAVFGTGTDGTRLTVSLEKEAAVISRTTTIREGKFLVYLPPMPAGGPYRLLVSDGTDTIAFEDVMLGDLWLAGGQSNMEFEMYRCDEYDEALAAVSKDNENTPEYQKIRYYHVPHIPFLDDQSEALHRASKWQLCTPDNLPAWSAVGFFFARRLLRDVDVTIGLIDCNWGGTSASAWMDADTLGADKDTAVYLEDYQKATEGRSLEEYLAELEDYKAYAEVWEAKKQECYEKNPDIDWNEVLEICGPCRWPGPMGPRCEYRPCGLYESMLAPCAPYSLKGFIYYQGESDEHHPAVYYKLLRAMVEKWRRDFRDDTLPFLNVQLTMFKNKTDADCDTWGFIRDAQMKVFQTLKNTGIAVIPDLGKFNDIHPTTKKPVGERLALQALYHVYSVIKNPADAFGPIFRDAVSEGAAMKLRFDYAPEGFIIDYKVTNYVPDYATVSAPTPAPECDSSHILGFELAGPDKVWHKADAVAYFENGEHGFYISSPNVSEPLHVRYLWINWAPVTVFGTNGLPLAPFSYSLS